MKAGNDTCMGETGATAWKTPATRFPVTSGLASATERLKGATLQETTRLGGHTFHETGSERMPFINVALFEGRSAEEKKAVARGFARVMEEELGTKPEHLWIRFADTALEDWFTGPDSALEIRERRLAAKEAGNGN